MGSFRLSSLQTQLRAAQGNVSVVCLLGLALTPPSVPASPSKLSVIYMLVLPDLSSKSHSFQLILFLFQVLR